MSATKLARDQALRVLADALVRLAEGNQIERDWLIEHLATSESSGQSVTPGELLEVPEACARLRISKWSLYQLIHQRTIGTVKIGRRRFIPSKEVTRFIDELTAAGGAL
ncbi:helix-turn-helix domain-containing protein [Nocardia aurea]|uniref:Helix-turn-helix domain-containing protein n=1 Tax=Nocardia aurea TaxID=2144174 RepID=A0ABV3FYZ1_9NOCA